ncbi:CBS domain-containing protein [Pigmentibacter sp. JX0631]|uniref:CBS domain-containing protein n=1 Tax=Pigmentibacter sp. JX0631 TaxID=2976982 RepID=UPI0024687465|nr:CBS domain-containing protein [Pigmentibacter sp. JX0631]WGL59770.1 CBS domain-containing protein [Pigmentibacter sp. JX0631]
MIVSDIMTKDPVLCTPDVTLLKCAQLMSEYDCGEIPVVNTFEEKKIIGVITDRDITSRGVAKNLIPSSSIVEECMSKIKYTLNKNDSLEKCIKIMSDNQVRRLPVVDENFSCIGIVSQAQISRFCSSITSGNLLREISSP